MGLVQNLKKTLSDWGDKILVELSSVYIKQLAKQTLKKQDNSSSTEFSQNPLTQEDLHTTIATSSADTSEKITMMETEDIVVHVRDWAMERLDVLNKKGVEGVYDQLAVIDEFHEWLDIDNKDELEIVTLDEINEDDYNDFVDYMNDGTERG
ncbi:hypothetical protein SSM2_174 [Synechococcus phage S-SM2]|uniref:Uncharacterized protein n=1 Tax=Synechococcus phage S-SM2 TaxID=444860 RepID=E3SJ67_9CAUD|nr:hypothetical protein SSM2_174 [Synechococcus phage S-SM2]ADO97515.1 hypothetical protein SSM2_174 [Synechococcus phage S-SM2]